MENYHEMNTRFSGLVKSVKLHTNIMGYGPTPGADDEIEQEISLFADGKGMFISYNYGDGGERCPVREKKSIEVSELTAGYLLSAAGLCFENGLNEDFVCDAGSWDLTITNTEGKVFHYSASVTEGPAIDGNSLSKLFRKHLDMPYLYMFDGASRYPVKVSEDELIFVSVVFDESENEYCYICDDPLIQVDDEVIVPAGRLDDKTPATVVAVEVLKKEDAPYPLEKCKRVISRVE